MTKIKNIKPVLVIDVLKQIKSWRRTRSNPNRIKNSVSKSKSKKLRAILEAQDSDLMNQMRCDPPVYVPPSETVPRAPLRADDWQEFKRKFVEEYGGEPIEPTGMSHSEFMDYIKTAGVREGDEFDDEWQRIYDDLRESKKEQEGFYYNERTNYDEWLKEFVKNLKKAARQEEEKLKIKKEKSKERQEYKKQKLRALGS